MIRVWLAPASSTLAGGVADASLPAPVPTSALFTRKGGGHELNNQKRKYEVPIPLFQDYFLKLKQFLKSLLSLSPV